MTTLISPQDFTTTTNNLRTFFNEHGFLEVHTQNRLSILAACEDPTTVATMEYNGQRWPLPQTGQMWLEYELLTRPEISGCYCLSTSYRQEDNPIAGRHDTIFPMFEFESLGNFDDLLALESELLTFLGFTNEHHIKYENTQFPGGRYLGVCAKLTAQDNDITAAHEKRIYEEYGDVFFLTHFPFSTSPFWNMKHGVSVETVGVLDNMIPVDRKADVALKADVIIGGRETIGSAERETNVQTMKEQFYSISNGEYAELLFKLFGKDRVNLELFEFLTHDFKPRYGGGIGITRLIAGMKKAGLM
jgi:aspartyl/asparaginyl-tRNA synthetase